MLKISSTNAGKCIRGGCGNGKEWRNFYGEFGSSENGQKIFGRPLWMAPYVNQSEKKICSQIFRRKCLKVR